MNNLHSIVYASTASRPVSHADLEALLLKCQSRNAAEGVTGLLMYCEGKFTQCIEGPEEGLLRVYASILADPLHFDITEIVNESVSERAFKSFTMAFSPADIADFDALTYTSTASAEQKGQSKWHLHGKDLLRKVWISLRKAGY
jgi:hypothetical protein